MKITNASSTNGVVIHDELGPNQEEQYQGGLKEVTLAPSATVIVANSNAGESRSLQTVLADGTVTIATQSDLSVEPSDEVAAPDTVPAMLGNLVGTGGVTFLGVISVPATGDYIFGFTPGYANADKIVRGFEFADASEVLAQALADSTDLTDISVSDADVDHVTFSNADVAAHNVLVIIG